MDLSRRVWRGTSPNGMARFGVVRDGLAILADEVGGQLGGSLRAFPS